MAVPDIGTVCWLPIEAAMVPESESKPTRPINLAAKQTGKPTAGNPHGGFDAAGIGNGLTAQLVRHSQRKRGATDVRPAKAGMFSGRQSHRGKSRNPVAWVAYVEETKRMKPTDKAILGMVSESPGRNESEPIGGLETPSTGSRAPICWAKAV